MFENSFRKLRYVVVKMTVLSVRIVSVMARAIIHFVEDDEGCSVIGYVLLGEVG